MGLRLFNSLGVALEDDRLTVQGFGSGEYVRVPRMQLGCDFTPATNEHPAAITVTDVVDSGTYVWDDDPSWG